MNVAVLDALASSQWGLVLRSQALGVLTTEQIEHALKVGALQSVRRSVYRVPGSGNGYMQQLAAITLPSGGTVVASHRCAARLHGLPGYQSALHEVTVNNRRISKIAGVRIHERALPPEQVTVVDGIQVTKIARTLVDLCAVAHVRKVESLVDFALFKDMTTVAELLANYQDVMGRGYRRTTSMKAILDRRINDKTHSELERQARAAIRRSGLPEPNGQFPLRTASGNRYPDMYYPAERVAIESMGYSAHGARTSFDSDAKRQAELAAAGILVLPFTSSTIESEFIEQLRAALNRRAA